MSRISRIILIVFMGFSSVTFGQKLWQPFLGHVPPSNSQALILPTKYQLIEINRESMRLFLNNLSKSPQQASTIVLPNPIGDPVAFKIWESPILSPPLQKKYPNIRTYSAVSLKNPFVTAKIDYTTKGFHAMVYNVGHDWMISPYSHDDDGYYMVFYQADAPTTPQERMVCKLGRSNNGDDLSISGHPVQVQPSDSKVAQRASGNVKRSYRLALSCTGEYAVAVAGNNPTKANVLSAMTTTMNRVNGIYEREFDITLVMIPQEDDLIYLNPNTDPFTANSNGHDLLDENQDNTDLVVGNSAYDIGHIFSTGGGGVAQLRSVCNPYNSKARGVTGMLNPVGDAFAVDYVSHEMGHQFGAEHAFNDCSGNENPSTAYEPGSGSTIMCYAGICGSANNLQEHSNDYFHGISLIQIGAFIDSWGGTCASTSTLNVDIPSFSSIQNEFVIPAATPFELTAPQATTTSSVNNLSYCWEQWNLGNLYEPEGNGAQFTAGPSFRSYYPKENNPVRIFPNIDSLLNNNTQFRGERLPLVSRYLFFKLTVRNIKNGFGSFRISDDSLRVKVVNTGAAFQVTSPNNVGVNLQANDDIMVKWDIAGTQNSPIQCQTVDVYFSTDGGYTYPYTIATNVPNSGQATVTIPNINTTKGRIKVKGHNNIFFDISNYDLTVQGTTDIDAISLKSDIDVFPNPATSILYFKSIHRGLIKVNITNLLGQNAWRGQFKKHFTLSTQKFAKGIYLIQLENTNSGDRTTKKIIIR